mmetsp:Transcript_45484/g.119496  ORF Transcript_45484/g.119496 Transcript_45484/m.119496 type:complete len:204 (+) Transcript_45484:181-792(+)
MTTRATATARRSCEPRLRSSRPIPPSASRRATSSSSLAFPSTTTRRSCGASGRIWTCRVSCTSGPSAPMAASTGLLQRPSVLVTTRSLARSSFPGAAGPRSTAVPVPCSARSGCCALRPKEARTRMAWSPSWPRFSRCHSSRTPTSSPPRCGPTTRRCTLPSSTASSRIGTARRPMTRRRCRRSSTPTCAPNRHGRWWRRMPS